MPLGQTEGSSNLSLSVDKTVILKDFLKLLAFIT